jgi:DNA-binding IclR family transcriptional regulator
MAKKAKADYLVQSVSRALDILEAFSPRERLLGVTDLARKLKLHKNNVFRLLATLETRGYVEQDKETGHYRLGIKTYEVAAVFLRQMDLRRQARPLLESLSEKSGETVYLAVLDRSWAVYLEMVENAQPVCVAPRLAQRLPAHATASGKMLLALLSREQQEATIGQEPLPRFTSRTAVEPGSLLEHLSSIAERGYAVEDEEYQTGVRGVAAPVRDLTRRVVGAVECSAPAIRLSPERLRGEVAPAVMACAEGISTALGAASPAR